MISFGEYRRSVINRDNIKPVARHLTSGNHRVSDMRILKPYACSDKIPTCLHGHVWTGREYVIDVHTRIINAGFPTLSIINTVIINH